MKIPRFLRFFLIHTAHHLNVTVVQYSDISGVGDRPPPIVQMLVWGHTEYRRDHANIDTTFDRCYFSLDNTFKGTFKKVFRIKYKDQ